MEYIEDKAVFNRYLYRCCHCANAGQSPEERRLKYAIARYFGKGVIDARRLRDWNRQPFAKYFGYCSWEILSKSLEVINNAE